MKRVDVSRRDIHAKHKVVIVGISVFIVLVSAVAFIKVWVADAFQSKLGHTLALVSVPNKLCKCCRLSSSSDKAKLLK